MKIAQSAVRAEQIRGLYTQSLTAVVANIVSGTLLCFILQPVVSHTRIALWMAALVCIQFARGAALIGFRRKEKKNDDLRLWGKLFTGIVLISSSAWGSVGIFLLPDAAVYYHAVIAMWMIGVSAGGIIAYAGYTPSALAGFLPITLPITVRFFLTGDLAHVTMALTVCAYAVFILTAWRRVQRLLVQAIELNFVKENEIEERKRVEEALVLVNRKLEKAASEIKTLQGILPICAQCKKIRDDQGSWNRIESYIKANSEVEFTHSICPECTTALYPNLKFPDKKP